MDTLTVNRRALLTFMNEGDKLADGHHTALTGLLGEPLAGALIAHYLASQGKNPEIVNWKVTSGTTRGRRLDAWISDGAGTLYQTEIKMWAGNAIGGLRLKPGLNPEELRELGRKQWLNRLWNTEKNTLKAESVSKVLGKMRPPAEYEAVPVEPLLCLWWLVYPTDEAGPWFRVPLSAGQHLNVFSLTAYLMALSDETLELPMPLLTTRLAWLGQILPGLRTPKS